jgi:hypothetical protein
MLFISADGSPRRLYSTGEVTDKEYCLARKVSLTVCSFKRDSDYFLVVFPEGVESSQKGHMCL